MRTRDMICFQMIRSVRDISRDHRARIATCSLRMATDRFKANYCVDVPVPNKVFNVQRFIITTSCVSSGHSYIRKLLQVNGVY